MCVNDLNMRKLLDISKLTIPTMAIGVSLWFVFEYAPIESNMGIVQKIFYFHVPSAYSMYLGWMVCTACSIAYITTQKETWDMGAKASAELALLFGIMVMITGPLWGRKSWGAYWVWDPRLTSALLLTLIILSYVLLRSMVKGTATKKFSAALAIVGAAIIPLVHLSVYKWRGQHPTVLKSGGLEPEMLLTFGICMFTFTLVFIALFHQRYTLEKQVHLLATLRQKNIAGQEEATN